VQVAIPRILVVMVEEAEDKECWLPSRFGGRDTYRKEGAP